MNQNENVVTFDQILYSLSRFAQVTGKSCELRIKDSEWATINEESSGKELAVLEWKETLPLGKRILDSLTKMRTNHLLEKLEKLKQIQRDTESQISQITKTLEINCEK